MYGASGCSLCCHLAILNSSKSRDAAGSIPNLTLRDSVLQIEHVRYFGRSIQDCSIHVIVATSEQAMQILEQVSSFCHFGHAHG